MDGQLMLEVIKDAKLLFQKILMQQIQELLTHYFLSLLNTFGQLNSEVKELLQ
jgi:hypothetical protein